MAQDFANKVAEKLAEEIGRLARGQKKMTPRALLKRFGYARRGPQVNSLIAESLACAGVACAPSLEIIESLDDTLILSLAVAANAAPMNAVAMRAPVAAPCSPAAPTSAPASAPPPTSASNLTPQQILNYAQQATVLISAKDGHGSGFIVDRNGLIATARHVVGRAPTTKVQFHDGSEAEGKVLSSNATLDFAFVHVPPCRIGFRLRGEVEPYAGQRVFAIGSPRDPKLRGTVTAGIISNASRVEGGVEYLQTDTSISPGNSGGPLIAEDGTVIGMNVWGRTDGAGLNFALPASYLSSAMEHLKPHLLDIEKRVYCVDCGFLNAPDRWIECRTWICCGNCGTQLGELKTEKR